MQNPESAPAERLYGPFFDILSKLCGCLSVVGFISGLGFLAVALWGLMTGSGWYAMDMMAALAWGLGMNPLPTDGSIWSMVKILLAALPAFLALGLLGVLFNKLSDGLDKLSG